jgi:putative ABC transport system permease protein
MASEQAPRAGDILISGDYFAAMGISLIRGRTFGDRDTGGSLPVAIVSETLARQVFPGEDPIGRRIRLDERLPMACCAAAGPVENVWREIVGVVADIRQANLDEAPAATIYRPFTQIVEHDMFLMVRARTDRDMPRVAAALPGVLRNVDPGIDWWDVRPMRQVIADSGAIRARRFVVRLLGAFAALALVLAGIGLYGVMAYFVAERRREIAVRVALGATRTIVLTQVLAEAVRLLAIGLVTGAIAAQLLTRFIASLLFGVGASDVPTHLAVFAVLVTVTLLASYLPAHRAARIDPIAALRE